MRRYAGLHFTYPRDRRNVVHVHEAASSPVRYALLDGDDPQEPQRPLAGDFASDPEVRFVLECLQGPRFRALGFRTARSPPTRR